MSLVILEYKLRMTPTGESNPRSLLTPAGTSSLDSRKLSMRGLHRDQCELEAPTVCCQPFDNSRYYIGFSYGWSNVFYAQLATEELQKWYYLQELLYASGGESFPADRLRIAHEYSRARKFIQIAVTPTWRTPNFVADGTATVTQVEPIVVDFDAQLRYYSN